MNAHPSTFANAAEIVSRPAIQHVAGPGVSAILIDSSQEAGRAALARWSHIPDEERAKWAKPADTRTFDQVCDDIDAAFGRRAGK